jgi:tRNA A-37 threonylcarbamoyl transferase component Bud32
MASRSPTRTAGGGRERFEPPDPARLAERFPQLEVLELIGHGGMGAVYKARQPGLDRIVALKILDPDRVRDPAFAERFGREARTLARLSHPHIVAVHEFGEVEGLYYFVMEYVDGATLREVMETGRLSPANALALVPQLCDALQFAHESGVVHRDIKPENILLDRSGRVKIADFGLAKLLEPDRGDGVSLTVSGETMGTPAYMAPEQIEHPLDVDHRADIYAVGVIFYEMLTGELPLGRFDPPSRKVRVDLRLDQVVLRALEKEPTRRYQLASEVKADVESLGSGAGAETATEREAGREAPPDPTRRTIEITRPPLVAWLGAWSLLMAGACCLGGLAAVVAPLLWMFGTSRTAASAGAPFLFPPFAGAMGLATLSALIVVLAVWHAIAGFGVLRLRNWARFNLIILAGLELPGILLAPFSWLFVALLPVTIVSALILVYLFQPRVARVFELGTGTATLPAAEADALESFLGRRRW